MASPADSTIAALRTGHDALAARVRSLSDDELAARSGADEWTVAQVLSHLGSGAEIAAGTLDHAAGGEPPAADRNQEVWARWDAMPPREQAESFVAANAALVDRYEDLDDDARTTRKIDLGFLPQPVDVAFAAGLRLNEFALHRWDAEVAEDPAAEVSRDAVEPMLEVVSSLLGWVGKPDVLDRPTTVLVRLEAPDRSFGLRVDDAVSLVDAPDAPDATLTITGAAWLRLLVGRLRADRTPPRVTITGDVTLDQLREVFPGF